MFIPRQGETDGGFKSMKQHVEDCSNFSYFFSVMVKTNEETGDE